MSTTHTSLITRTLCIGVAVAGLSACGGALGSDTGAASTTTVVPTTEAPTTVPAPSTTVAPAPTITLPPAPTAPPTPATTAPAPTTPAVTSGSLDLGDGVSVPVEAGWAGKSENGLVTMTDGRIAVSLLVVKRIAGEHPKDVIDDYIALIIDKLGVVTYSAANREWTTETPRAAMQYQLFYSVDDNGETTQGGLSTFVRDDGLVLLYDVWAPTGTTGALPDGSFQSMLNSFLDAPLIANPVVLTAVPEFQVTSIHPQG